MNEFFNRALTQFTDFWRNLTPGQRFLAGGIGGTTLALLLAIIFFVRQTQYVPLGTFDLQQAALIKAELDKKGWTINNEYRLTADGRKIEVDAKRRNEINVALAEKGLFGNVEQGFSIFDKFDITNTEYEQRIKNLEALKSEMRKLVRSYSQVEDIAITAPYLEQQPLFTKDQIDQTASVVLNLRTGARLENEQIKAIRRLIAGGFPGLKEENVTLTDQFMSQLLPEDEEQGLSTRQSAIERETEKSLTSDIRKMLGPVLGEKNFTVAVNVEFDWDNVKQNDVVYSQPGFEPLVESKQSEEEIFTGQGIRPGGEPGVTPNSPVAYQDKYGLGPVDYKRKEEIVNNLSNKSVTERIRSPYVKRLSAAVAVDGLWTEGTDSEGNPTWSYTPRLAEEMRDIEALVKSAVGQNVARGDGIEVRNMKYSHEAERKMVLDERRRTEKFWRVGLFAAGAAPLIAAFFMLWMAWRRHQRLREEDMARTRELERQRALAAAEAGLVGEISLEEQERQEIQRRASSLARAKPQIVADLLRTWLADEPAPA